MQYVLSASINREHFFTRGFVTVTLPSHVRSAAELPEWDRCPNGTNYVVKRRAGQGAGYYTVGCCPEGQKGLMFTGVDRIAGCCPLNQTFVYDRTGRRFRGCVDSICQAGNSVICKGEYGYCRAPGGKPGMCAPHNGDPCDFDSYCQAHGKTIKELAWDTPHSMYHTLGIKPHNWKTYKYRERLYDNSTGPEGGFIGATLTPPVKVCNGTNMPCHETDECDTVIATLDHGGGTFTTRAIETYCCSPGHRVCTTSPRNRTTLNQGDLVNPIFVESYLMGDFVGCATPEETCCGVNVCPAEHKCCSEEGVGNFCCPNALQCCRGDPFWQAIGIANPPANQIHTVRNYCGIPVNGIDCAMDRDAPGLSYILNRNRGLLLDVS